MMHSVTFGDKNSYDEWRIVPTSRPVINPPAKKKKTLEIPGANGSLDISDSLTGFPVFENRTGSIEFIVLNDFNYDPVAEWEAYDTETGTIAEHRHNKDSKFKWTNGGIMVFVQAARNISVGDTITMDSNVKPAELPIWIDQYQWDEVYHDVLRHLHGEKMEVRLEDEPGYFYEGGITVNSWKSDKANSTITIDYDLQPYRYANEGSTDNWLWDPFNFTKDYIAPMKFAGIQVDGTEERVYEAALFGNAPLMPELLITTDTGMTVTVQTPAEDLADGKKSYTKTFTQTGNYKIYELTLYKTSVKYTFTGSGTVSIKFHRGYI